MADSETKLDMLNSHAMLCNLRNWIFATADAFIHEYKLYLNIISSDRSTLRRHVNSSKLTLFLFFTQPNAKVSQKSSWIATMQLIHNASIHSLLKINGFWLFENDQFKYNARMMVMMIVRSNQ